MERIDLEIEISQLSMYSDIICGILKTHNELSLVKLVVFTYLIKKEKFLNKTVFTALNKNNLVNKALSLLSGDYTSFCDNIPYIIKAIDILIKKDQIIYIGELLKSNINCKNAKIIYTESQFFINAIEESKTVLDRQFLKEVTSNV